MKHFGTYKTGLSEVCGREKNLDAQISEMVCAFDEQDHTVTFLCSN